MHASRSLAGVAIVLITLLCAPAVAAQMSYDVIRAFPRPPEQPTGPPVEIAPGVFAIAMLRGGPFDRGAVLRFDRQSDGSLRSAILHAFNGADGAGPGPLMRGNDGALYGTTKRGGGADEGTAFRLTADGQLSTLHSFSGDRAFPNGLMLRTASGDFYGTLGGMFGVIGKVFKLTPGGTLTIVPISIFMNSSLQDVRLVETATGQLYGINHGLFFRMQPDGEALLLRDLSDEGYRDNGYSGIVAGSDGNFYVNVIDYGNLPTAPDVIVRLTPAGAFSIVRVFPTSAGVPGLIEGTDGHLYGVALQTAQVFRLTKGGAFTTLHTFSYWDGYQPISLMQASTGELNGSTIGGGTSNRGTLFEINSSGFAVRSHFSDPAPLNPVGTLVRGIDGALYGSSCAGGDYNAGTVFRITDAGALAVAHSFRYWDGICPSGLTRTSDGTLWGTARASLFGQGTIFKISPAGVFTLIRILGPADGQRPLELCLASDGNLYGTTTKGGSSGLTAGTVFRVTPGGVFTVMHAFTVTSGLHHPWSGVVQGTDGALYGVAIGHDGAPASAFRVTLDGLYAEVAWGLVPSWAGPRLMPRADGGFIGFSGPPSALFSVTSSGAPSILYSLSESDGTFPIGDLVLAAGGQLYGTAWSGGATNQGTVFRVTTTGVFEKLHDFGGLDGANPYSGLFESAPGVFYGTAVAGGPGNGGVIFRLVMNPPPF